MGFGSQRHQPAALSLPLLNLNPECACDSRGAQASVLFKELGHKGASHAIKGFASDTINSEHMLLTASCIAMVLQNLTWQSIPMIDQPA